MSLYILAAAFFVGNLVLFALLCAERRRHRMSRRALAFWREFRGGGPCDQVPRVSGVIKVDLAEFDQGMIRARDELRRQIATRTSRATRAGDAA